MTYGGDHVTTVFTSSGFYLALILFVCHFQFLRLLSLCGPGTTIFLPQATSIPEYNFSSTTL